MVSQKGQIWFCNKIIDGKNLGILINVYSTISLSRVLRVNGNLKTAAHMSKKAGYFQKYFQIYYC